ncbi:hypothetical protein FRC19_007414 [Serendipita sp. 401]|nr:hypothetical protein FRC19_007414 [Serendipita sp. 401]KAG9052484.1 hypothetical protein FS842_009785 [Serendipita sp. 407]
MRTILIATVLASIALLIFAAPLPDRGELKSVPAPSSPSYVQGSNEFARHYNEDNHEPKLRKRKCIVHTTKELIAAMMNGYRCK